MATVSKETIEILSNEYADIVEMLTPNVTVKRMQAPEGSLLLLEFVVHAKSHYVTGEGDTSPKETESMTFYLDVKNGFPRVAPIVYYAPGKYLASINVYRYGRQCIDTWHYDENHSGNNSTLSGTVRKTIMDIIHDPSVSNERSMANSDLHSWYRSKVSAGVFPTCNPRQLIKSDTNDSYVVNSGGRPTVPARPTTANTNVRPTIPQRGA